MQCRLLRAGCDGGSVGVEVLCKECEKTAGNVGERLEYGIEYGTILYIPYLPELLSIYNTVHT